MKSYYTDLQKNTKGIGELCKFLTDYNLSEQAASQQ